MDPMPRNYMSIVPVDVKEHMSYVPILTPDVILIVAMEEVFVMD